MAKITFLGGGALRLLGVVDEILKSRKVFSKPDLFFMDTDLARAQTVAMLSTKLPAAADNMPIARATDDLGEALEGADFVYCCIRVGGVHSLERDKRIAASHGFNGHDDFGPSAVMLAARTIPVVLDIAAQMQWRCPDAWLLIFTNPITLLADAVARHSRIRCVGLCAGVYNFAYDMDHLFDIGVPCDGLTYRGGGLNHLSWVSNTATFQGEPIMRMVRRSFDDLADRPGAERAGWERLAPLVDLYDAMFMNNGHQHHFFYHEELARETAERYVNASPDGLRSVEQERAADQARALAQQSVIEDFWQQPPFRNCAAGAMGDLGAQFMSSVIQDAGLELGINIPNRGHILGLPDDTLVEAHSRVWKDRLEPLALDPVPNELKGLCCHLAHHQRLVTEASIKSDRDALLRALLAEPTINCYRRAKRAFDELWSAGEAQINEAVSTVRTP